MARTRAGAAVRRAGSRSDYGLSIGVRRGCFPSYGGEGARSDIPGIFWIAARVPGNRLNPLQTTCCPLPAACLPLSADYDGTDHTRVKEPAGSSASEAKYLPQRLADFLAEIVLPFALSSIRIVVPILHIRPMLGTRDRRQRQLGLVVLVAGHRAPLGRQVARRRINHDLLHSCRRIPGVG